MTRTGIAGLALAAAALAGACSTTEPCGPVAPSRMPGGSEPQAYATSVSEGAPVAIWRVNESFVVQRIVAATASGEPACPDGELPGPADGCLEVGDVEVRGEPALLAPIGQDGAEADQWLLAWSSGGCRYETSFGPLGLEEAQAYAAGY